MTKACESEQISWKQCGGLSHDNVLQQRSCMWLDRIYQFETSLNTISFVVAIRKTLVAFCQAQQGWSVPKQTDRWGASILHALSFIVTTETFIKLHHPL